MDEQLLELTRQVTILNERIPNHIQFTEHHIADHESRLRAIEATNTQIVVADYESRLRAIEATNSQIEILSSSVAVIAKKLEVAFKLLWSATGGLAVLVFVLNYLR